MPAPLVMAPPNVEFDAAVVVSATIALLLVVIVVPADPLNRPTETPVVPRLTVPALTASGPVPKALILPTASVLPAKLPLSVVPSA